jgi:hypothetical protein
MAARVKLRRGTSNQHTTFTGSAGEVTVDTTDWSLRVHDGSTAGGQKVMKTSLSNIDAGAIINGGTYT